MDEIRSFIAIDLPPDFLSRLEQASRRMKELLPGVPIRWVPVKNLHLTLKFLGNVPAAKLDGITNLIKLEASRHPVFEIGLGEPGAFPSINRPRVIWVGVDAPQELLSLATGIDKEAQKAGFPREERPFSPHLTLGRVGERLDSRILHSIGEAVSSVELGFKEKAAVKEIHLYRSDLLPGGAVYTTLFTARLSDTRAG